MTWAAFALVALLAASPALLGLLRGDGGRDRRQAAMTLHRAQLAELDRDLAAGGIAPADHMAATLEVQRRLLADAAMPAATARTGRREPVLLALVMAPALALALYAVGDHVVAGAPPQVAADPSGDGITDDSMAELQRMIASAEPDAEATRASDLLLGRMQEQRGDLAAAASAWRHALDIRFDPVLAMRTADAESRADGRIGLGAAALFRRALDAAPADAPWRGIVEQRLAEAGAP